MKLLVVNPNTTASMTRDIGAAARAVAAPGTEIVAVNGPDGPASIEGYYDEAFAVPGMLREIARARDVDGVVIACFDDTGLDAARCLVAAPVVGIGEAAFHIASLLGERFSVVTTLARSIGAIEKNLVRYGLASRCARVRAADVAVLALDDPSGAARRAIEAQIDAALRDDGAEAIVLGCAGMAAYAADLSRAFGVPVVDGVAAAVKLVEATVALGLTTSKRGGYATPLGKTYSGMFSKDGHGA